jgi:dTDP-4-dehydrorhamnose 3,5-epimerase
MKDIVYFGTLLEEVSLMHFGSSNDHRGEFNKIYSEDKFNIFEKNFFDIKQINHSITIKKGTIRGMHFQKPLTEKKIIKCIRGSIFDVVVDLRYSSKNYLKWMGMTISKENQISLLMPEGFAHGFQALENNCELIYLHSEEYVESKQFGLKFDDPILAIKWPLKCMDISKRDSNFDYIKNLSFKIV